MFDFKDEGFEQLEGLGRQAKQTVKQAPKKAAATVASQVKGTSGSTTPAADHGGQADPNGYTQDEQQKILEQMYGSSPVKQDPQAQQGQKPGANPQQNDQSVMNMITGSHTKEKTPEEEAKLKQLRDKLHYEMYYKPIDESGKTKQQGEESVQAQKEKVEEEEKQKKQLEEQKKEKTKQDLAVANARKGTGETMKGIGG